MNAVVTGCAGFIGFHLCRRLLDEGTKVVGIDNLLTGRPEHVVELARSRNFSFHRVDVAEQRDVATLLERTPSAEIVFHLASPASPRDYERHPLATLRANSAGTDHVLTAAQRSTARFVLASTSEVYGEPRNHPQRESDWGNVNPVGPRSCYDEAKRFAEALVAAQVRSGGVDGRIVRIFNTYGPGMRADDGRVIPAFICAALAGEPIVVEGDGSQTRSFTYVDDLVDGLLRAARAPRGGPLVINLGNPAETTIAQLAAHLADILERELEVRYAPLPPDCPTRRRPDISLARTALGWEPRVDLRDGLARTVGWFSAAAPRFRATPARAGRLRTARSDGRVDPRPSAS